MLSGEKIYLDYNATTPADPRVVDVMLPYFTEKFGNASSDHVFGWDADEAMELAREKIAKLIDCRPTELTFTSGATEAANLALFGFCERNKHSGNHIISCKTEHKAVLDTLHALGNNGFGISFLDVDSDGNIDLEQLESTLNSETILVSLMMANNETGLTHPIKKIGGIVHAAGAHFMSDITQIVGKVPLNLKELDIDLAVFSSHKIYGPKGVGALFINKKKPVELDPVFYGGGQEKGIRPGTSNVPGIVGFGTAAEIANFEMNEESARILSLRKRLETGLEKIDGARINSKDCDRLPNTVNVSFEGIDGTQLLRKLNNLAVSRGSACTSNTVKPSHVLQAMGLSDELALSSLRISLGRYTTSEEIGLAIEHITETVNKLKQVVL